MECRFCKTKICPYSPPDCDKCWTAIRNFSNLIVGQNLNAQITYENGSWDVRFKSLTNTFQFHGEDIRLESAILKALQKMRGEN